VTHGRSLSNHPNHLEKAKNPAQRQAKQSKNIKIKLALFNLARQIKQLAAF